MERFITELKNRWVRLVDKKDAVRFSFIVQNSLSPLNLDLLEYSNFQNRSRTASEVANDFVNSEEKCRKIFAPSRSLLYTLNLDMPAGREYSLKNRLCTCAFSGNDSVPHIARILLSCCFYHNIVSDLIENALGDRDQILNVVAILLEHPFLNIYLYRIKPHLLNKFIDCFYPIPSDFQLFSDFIRFANITDWMVVYEKPEILSSLLYYVRRNGRELEAEGRSMGEIIDICILRCLFKNIKPILMYTDAPGISLQLCEKLFDEISLLRPNVNEDTFEEAMQLIPPERIFLIMQIFWMYLKSSEVYDTKEALRLLWNSRPDHYINFQEVKVTFSRALSDQEIKDMYMFYCDSIDVIPSEFCPRKLQQLCRTVIRRTLKENDLWIPEGISRTGQPTYFKMFLNLEKMDCFRF